MAYNKAFNPDALPAYVSPLHGHLQLYYVQGLTKPADSQNHNEHVSLWPSCASSSTLANSLSPTEERKQHQHHQRHPGGALHLIQRPIPKATKPALQQQQQAPSALQNTRAGRRRRAPALQDQQHAAGAAAGELCTAATATTTAAAAAAAGAKTVAPDAAPE